MRDPDALDELVQDLRALPRRERRAVLDSLSEVERTKLSALLAGPVEQPDPQPRIDDGHDLLSPCLRARLADGDEQRPAENVRWKMTPSSRLLLRQSARTLLERSAGAAPRQSSARRSLAGAVGDLLFGNGDRR